MFWHVGSFTVIHRWSGLIPVCGLLSQILGREIPREAAHSFWWAMAFGRFCHGLWSFHHRLWIQKWLVNFPFPCRCQHMCLISGINAKTSRFEFSSLLDIKGFPPQHMGISALLLNKAPPRASSRVLKRQGGEGRNSSFPKYCNTWGRWAIRPVCFSQTVNLKFRNLRWLFVIYELDPPEWGSWEPLIVSSFYVAKGIYRTLTIIVCDTYSHFMWLLNKVLLIVHLL